MDLHLDIKKMAAHAFAKHLLTRERGYCWRMGQPGRSAYSFRITWAPGAIIVTGDLGELVFQGLTTLWDGPWDAARFLVDCDYDYLMGKTAAKQVFDRDETVKLLISSAEENLKYGSPERWERICKRYSETYAVDYRTLDGRKVTDHMRAAKAMREDVGLDAGDVWRFDGDGDSCVYSYDPGTRWRYEALMLWARAVIPSEPLTSKLARERRRFRDFRRSFKHQPIIYRPELWTTGGVFNGHRFWTAHESDQGRTFRAIMPLSLIHI